MLYIIDHKKIDETIGMIDLISDFCLKKNVPIELVGDAIASDLYFKQFIETDVNSKLNKNKLDEW